MFQPKVPTWFWNGTVVYHRTNRIRRNGGSYWPRRKTKGNCSQSCNHKQLLNLLSFDFRTEWRQQCLCPSKTCPWSHEDQMRIKMANWQLDRKFNNFDNPTGSVREGLQGHAFQRIIQNRKWIIHFQVEYCQNETLNRQQTIIFFSRVKCTIESPGY